MIGGLYPPSLEYYNETINYCCRRKGGNLLAICQSFTKQYGIEISFVSKGKDGLLNFIPEAPADLVVTSVGEELEIAKRLGYLTKITAPVDTDNIPVRFRDPDLYWTGYSYRVRSIFINPNKVDVTVKATKPVQYSNTYAPTTAGTRIATKPINSSKTVQTIDAKAIEDQGATNVAQVIQQNIPGAGLNSNLAGNRSNVMFRGFNIHDNYGSKIDGQQNLTWADVDLYNIESVQVSKGPNAAFAGQSDPAGFIGSREKPRRSGRG